MVPVRVPEANHTDNWVDDITQIDVKVLIVIRFFEIGILIHSLLNDQYDAPSTSTSASFVPEDLWIILAYTAFDVE